MSQALPFWSKCSIISRLCEKLTLVKTILELTWGSFLVGVWPPVAVGGGGVGAAVVLPVDAGTATGGTGGGAGAGEVGTVTEGRSKIKQSLDENFLRQGNIHYFSPNIY